MPDHARKTGAEIITGIQPEFEKYKPNYSLVPNWDGSIIITSRGCVNSCPFCAVPKLEGEYKPRLKSILRQIDKRHSRIIFWDNNILASPHLDNIINQLKKSRKIIDFNQGLDARLITDKIARQLSKLNIPILRLAYDSITYKQKLENAITLLKKYKINPRKILVYTLFNFKDNPTDFLERLRTILSLGAVSYPMRYQPIRCLKKNSFKSRTWKIEQINNLEKARRILGYGGCFPPYKQLISKIDKAQSFDEAFEIWPLGWKNKGNDFIADTQIITRKRNQRFGMKITDQFIKEIGLINYNTKNTI